MANKLLIIAVLAILGTMATVTDAQPACASKLTPCFPFLNNATAKPTKDCCDPIKDAVANDLTCLCNIYNDPNLLQALNITVAAALRISSECGITQGLSSCNLTATSPTSAPPPPGQQAGGADKIALTGFSTLLLFLVSALFY
ncbi:hypothetical protein CCACVL1_02883 [Corchorus capsularis]|uniref:Bifunctional inhibitor/plant lipid transfer protein/seed storage helical domain-containing protein n=1 Tax=Corchorus capsularis TaxID=210143 RepID=A0A1R3K538_COCAP|nr:hypothetical protein CCACVL1_02883 [Corchorus capsularis]